MSSTTSEGIRITAPRIWSTQRVSRVVEPVIIGDGPHVRRPDLNRPHRPSNQNILTAGEQRPQTPVDTRNSLLRKISLQRSLAFYNQLRCTFGGAASGFGYFFNSDLSMRRQLGWNSYAGMFGSWHGFPIETEEEAIEDENIHVRRFFPERRHWQRAQLYFQQYLVQRHCSPHIPRSFSVKVDLSSVNLKNISNILYGVGMMAALKLVFNEVIHVH
ncbi:uncharacterized protein LOC108115101 [Drosophila eugracilis]|uniref:uncharacterized protein LOC108115101 n=1 Tax=Drosophila eugracilis TaxID=29029 RepID=UPI0007E63236|nr:uncharacterized protein LOC108115101 [Drosophila eugracilis]